MPKNGLFCTHEKPRRNGRGAFKEGLYETFP